MISDMTRSSIDGSIRIEDEASEGFMFEQSIQMRTYESRTHGHAEGLKCAHRCHDKQAGSRHCGNFRNVNEHSLNQQQQQKITI